MRGSILKILPLLTITVLTTSCKNDDSQTPVSQLSCASQIEIIDAENYGNASDMKLSFKVENESLVNNCRAIVVKSEKYEEFMVEDAINLSPREYVEAFRTNGQDVTSTSFPADLLDSDGDAIESGKSYNIVMLTILNNPETSYNINKVYDQITLAKTNIVEFVTDLPFPEAAISIDSEGNIYTYDLSQFLFDDIYKITPDGIRTHVFKGINPSGRNIAFDSNNNIHISGTYNNHRGLYRITPAGDIHLLDSSSYTSIISNSFDDLYAISPGRTRIEKIPSSIGTKSLVSNNSFVLGARDIGLSNNEDFLYALTNYNLVDRLVQISLANGEVNSLMEWHRDYSKYAKHRYRRRMELEYHQGYVYYSNEASDIISRTRVPLNEEIDNLSVINNFEIVAGDPLKAGNKLGAALKATFHRPISIAFHPNGKILYVIDKSIKTGNSRLLKIRLEKD